MFILKSVFIFVSLELKSLTSFLRLSFGKISTSYGTYSPGTLDSILDPSVLGIEISGLLGVVKAQKVFKFNLRFTIVCKNLEKNYNKLCVLLGENKAKKDTKIL